MRNVVTVIGRELHTHLRKVGFWAATLLLPLVLGVVMLVAAQADIDVEKRELGSVAALIAVENLAPIGYLDQSGLVRQVPAGFPPEFVRAYPTLAAGQAAVRANEIGTLFVVPADYLASGAITSYSSGLGLSGQLTADVFATVLRGNLLPPERAGLLGLLRQPMQLSTVALERPAASGASEAEQSSRLLLPMAMAMILALAIFTSGGMLLQAVIEEKENRTIEVVLSSISPHELLVGKVLGLGLLGLFQLALWLGLAAGLLGQARQSLQALGAASIAPTVWALAPFFFVLGYLVYAAFMAAIGAVSTSMRESSQLSALLTLPAAAPLLVLQPLTSDPGGPLAVTMSLLPLTSAITMPLRLVDSPVPAWQVALSLGLLVLAVGTTLWGAGRLFRASTLLAGQRLSLRQIGRALADR